MPAASGRGLVLAPSASDPKRTWTALQRPYWNPTLRSILPRGNALFPERGSIRGFTRKLAVWNCRHTPSTGGATNGATITPPTRGVRALWTERAVHLPVYPRSALAFANRSARVRGLVLGGVQTLPYAACFSEAASGRSSLEATAAISFLAFIRASIRIQFALRANAALCCGGVLMSAAACSYTCAILECCSAVRTIPSEWPRNN